MNYRYSRRIIDKKERNLDVSSPLLKNGL